MGAREGAGRAGAGPDHVAKRLREREAERAPAHLGAELSVGFGRVSVSGAIISLVALGSPSESVHGPIGAL